MIEGQEPERESPLKKRRDELGLTQRDVAVAVNISVQTVSNWETGRYGEAKLTLSQIKALCQVLKWTIEDLPKSFGRRKIESTVLSSGEQRAMERDRPN